MLLRAKRREAAGARSGGDAVIAGGTGDRAARTARNHALVKLGDRLAARSLKEKRQHGVNQTSHARDQHLNAEAAGVPHVLEVRLANGAGVLGEMSVNR